MRTYQGRITGLQLDEQGRQAAWIAAPVGAWPGAGQYLSAHAPGESDAALAAALFLGGITDASGSRSEAAFLALPAAPLPAAWLPGMALTLRGPLGQGFHLPANLRRLALAVLGDTGGRLLPLAHQALALGADVALFTEHAPAALPASLEIQPLAALPEALAWADLLALDLPLAALGDLRRRLRLEDGQRLPCPAQALVLADMPCAGLAACGACAVPSRRGARQVGPKLACEAGPVFNLEELEW